MIPARIDIDPRRVVGTVDRRLFGSFVEHLGGVYDGIYEPGHPEADAEGFRRDVIALVRELGVTTVRYPGGNFVSGYRWEDGVGPREGRPRRVDTAWHSIETNEIGLDDFSYWLRQVGAELMYAVNLGTRGVQEALDVLEYANLPSGTRLSDERVANGAAEPHDIRMWCLGNEMDGPWQLGHGTAEEYARLAAKTARAMRQFDSGLELVACGSSGSQMPSFGAWERTVLGECYDDVDYISCHAYYEPAAGDYGSFLASAVDMDRFIETVAAIADAVKAERGSDKVMKISFDEWNVWYYSHHAEAVKRADPQHWPIAPRLLEDGYSVMDAVVVGGLLISLLRHADRVKAASLAQLVNVIAPIMTEPGGAAWRQTTFFPFALTSRLARGVSLELAITAPEYRTERYGTVAVVDAAAVHDDATGATTVFAVNRSVDDDVDLVIDVASLGDVRLDSAQTLSDADMHAVNTAEDPGRIGMRDNASAQLGRGEVHVVLPPVSWSAVTLTRVGHGATP